MERLPKSCFLYLNSKVLRRRWAEVEQVPAGDRPTFGAFAAVRWGTWDDEGDAHLRDALAAAVDNRVKAVVRFQVVHPDKPLPSLIRGRPGLVAGSQGREFPTPAGWDVLLGDGAVRPHRAALARLAAWLRAAGVGQPWTELGSHGLWGEGHFNSPGYPPEAWPGPDVPQRIADDYAAVFGAGPAVVAFDWLLQPEVAGGPPREPGGPPPQAGGAPQQAGIDLSLLAHLRGHFPNLHLRFDALGGAKSYVDPFVWVHAEARKAGWEGDWMAETADVATLQRAIEQVALVPGFRGVAGRSRTGLSQVALFRELLAGRLWRD